MLICLFTLSHQCLVVSRISVFISLETQAKRMTALANPGTASKPVPLSLCLSRLSPLSPVGIRVLHPFLGESGIPAQHCQKVHRPEVCPAGECRLQRAASVLPTSPPPPGASQSRLFLPSSSWSCLIARILARETT